MIDTSNLIEEGFQKNSISCTIASSDGSCTLGFIAVPKALPKTLLSGDELDHSKAAPIKTILAKERTASVFSSILAGNLEDLVPNFEAIKSLLSEELCAQIAALITKANDTESEISASTEQPTTTLQASLSEPDSLDVKEPSES